MVLALGFASIGWFLLGSLLLLGYHPLTQLAPGSVISILPALAIKAFGLFLTVASVVSFLVWRWPGHFSESLLAEVSVAVITASFWVIFWLLEEPHT